MKVAVTKDAVSKVISEIRALTKNEVLVGVPQENAPRTDEEVEALKGAPITNAVIGYINEFGSPAANIPPRPHMIPGIASAKDKIAQRLGKGARAAMDGSPDAANVALTAAGLIGEAAVKSYITAGLSPPLAEVTLEHRRARGRTGEKPLQDTNQYLKSITHVVRPKGK